MHPLQRRFLDVAAVVSALEGEATDDDALALVAAVRAEAGLDKKLLATKGKALPNELQQKLIITSTKAAAARLLADPSTGPRTHAALDGVIAAGASKDEALTLVQQAVLDEGFGWPDDPGDFDVSFLLETVDALPALARVDADWVEAQVDAFVKQVDVKERPLRLAVADALLEAAWSDGPQPIAAEHVDDAMELLARSVASQELERAGETLVGFLTFLSAHGLVGPMRLARLTEVAKAAARAPALDDDEEADDETDEEE
ncbi:MAG: hypothetical protein SFW67_13995 [Myxococcaceae bacterium]|nr:hypothetical protein [Myxococcaceae bacterium]